MRVAGRNKAHQYELKKQVEEDFSQKRLENMHVDNSGGCVCRQNAHVVTCWVVSANQHTLYFENVSCDQMQTIVLLYCRSTSRWIYA